MNGLGLLKLMSEIDLGLIDESEDLAAYKKYRTQRTIAIVSSVGATIAAAILLVVFLGNPFAKKNTDYSFAPPTGTTSLTPTGATGPTGGTNSQIRATMIRVNGKLYECRENNVWDNLPPNDFKEAGVILEVNNNEIPTEDFCGGGTSVEIKPGQKVFTSDSLTTVVVVQCEEGYYYFHLREDADTEDPSVESTSSGRYSDRYYDPTTDEDGHLPTGAPEEVIYYAKIMVNGKLYECRENIPWDYLPPNDFKEAGVILEVNEYKIPTEDFCACGTTVRLRSGQKVYTSESLTTVVVVQIGDEYHYFHQIGEK